MAIHTGGPVATILDIGKNEDKETAYTFGICNLILEKNINLPYKLPLGLSIRNVTPSDKERVLFFRGPHHQPSFSMILEYHPNQDSTINKLCSSPHELANFFGFIVSSYFKPKISSLFEKCDMEYHLRPQLTFYWASYIENSKKIIAFDDFDKEMHLPRTKSNIHRLNKKNVDGFFKYLEFHLRLLNHLYIKMAIDRYLEIRKTNSRYRLINGIIAIELLVGEDEIPSISSIAYKVALRTSFIVGNNVKERLELYNFLKRAYVSRSKLIHGANKQTKGKFGDGDYDECILTAIIERLIIYASLQNKKVLGKYIDEKILESKKGFTL